MSIVSGMLNQNIDTVYSITEDRYGDKTRTTEYSNVQCRWQEKIGRIVDALGDYREYRIEAWVMPDKDILINYEVVKDSSTYKVVGRETRVNLDGQTDHVKLFLV